MPALMISPLLLSLGTAALIAQAVPSPVRPQDPPPQILATTQFHGVHIDQDRHADGGFWARGDRYKMRFAADGAQYLPLFSSRTPRHYPLHFRSEANVEPVLHANGCSFDRGDVVERWDLRPEGAEQSFVLRRRPAGDVLELPVATDLPFGGNGPQGLRFVAEGWGEVAYGQAFAIGADGARTALPTAWTGAAIRIELPADARYPLTVDPFVATIGVASNETFDNRNPDVAFEDQSGRWAVIMEERVSAFDTDIKVRRFDAAGVLLDTDYFESGTATATEPAIAAANSISVPSTFMSVWLEGTTCISRRIGAINASPNARVTVDSDVQRPDIAGSTMGRYAITYCVDDAITLPQLTTLVVTDTGSFLGRLSHGSFSGCIRPRIAEMQPNLQHWPITFSDQLSGCLAGDVKFLAINQNNGVEATITTIAGAVGDDDRNVDIAWNGTHGLVVWDRDMGSHHDIFGQVFTRTAAGYQMVGTVRNLTAMEPGITVSNDQQKPVVACDGVRFAVCYMEGSTPKPVCATFAVVNGLLVCHEGHVPIATANLDHDDHGIAAMGTTGGPTTRYFVVTDERDGSNDYDVQGLFYDGRQTGTMFTTVGTGCTPTGFAQPQLTVSGGSDLGNTFTLQIGGHRGLPFVMASSPLSPAPLLCFAGLLNQCRQGVALPLILAQFGTTLPVLVPTNTALVGATLAFQGLDLNATGACGTALLGLPFVVTDTVQATVR